MSQAEPGHTHCTTLSTSSSPMYIDDVTTDTAITLGTNGPPHPTRSSLVALHRTAPKRFPSRIPNDGRVLTSPSLLLLTICASATIQQNPIVAQLLDSTGTLTFYKSYRTMSMRARPDDEATIYHQLLAAFSLSHYSRDFPRCKPMPS